MTPPVLIVTGGGRGIGRAIALGAASRGYSVCFSYRRDADSARALVSEIENEGGVATAVLADVSQSEAAEHLFARGDELGTLVALVNNAGTMATSRPVVDMTAERLDAVFRTNVIGSFLCTAQAIKRMSTLHGGKGGAIVNLSSTAARIGGANGSVDYAASKGAIETFTRGLAIEVASQGIRVNAVAPGMVDTDIHYDTGDPERLVRSIESIPMRRIGTAEEIAASVLWLLSKEATYVTGSVLTVSGAGEAAQGSRDLPGACH